MRNNLNTKKYFNPLNDYFIRYLFTDKGSSEAILLDFINSIMINANMKTNTEWFSSNNRNTIAR